ncbi:MAG: RNA methyltransferase [Bacteroidales bacterium]|nr:RNA methyltransferase [Bacteroidales bacterium]
MQKISNDDLGRLSVEEFRAARKRRIVLVLDNIRSMHNVGSAFRTADAFLIEKIVLCGFTAQPPHREIQKSALGATESVVWEYTSDAVDAVRQLQANGYKVFAVEQVEGAVMLNKLDLSGDSVNLSDNFSVNIISPIALVFGNELDGVQQHVIDLCDGAIEIPQWGTKHSLNISVSIGITLWEIVRMKPSAPSAEA